MFFKIFLDNQFHAGIDVTLLLVTGDHGSNAQLVAAAVTAGLKF